MPDSIAANHYVLDGAISGTVDTISFDGSARVSLRFDGEDVQSANLHEDPIAGLRVTGFLGSRPDLDSRSLILPLPLVNVTDAGVPFATIALVVTARTSIAGPLVDGVVQTYEVHPVAGTAAAVDFLGSAATPS
jgi:hypothetical protein